jgi:hypothetical protein
MTVQDQRLQIEYKLDPTDCSMALIERSISINVPPEVIPLCFNDPTHYPILFPHVENVHADARYPGLGSHLHLGYRVAGIQFDIQYTVIEDRPGLRVLRSQSISQHFGMTRPFEGMTIWHWEHDGKATNLTGTYHYEIPQTAWGKELEKWVLRRYNAENLERSLRNIKRVLEGINEAAY